MTTHGKNEPLEPTLAPLSTPQHTARMTAHHGSPGDPSMGRTDGAQAEHELAAVPHAPSRHFGHVFGHVRQKLLRDQGVYGGAARPAIGPSACSCLPRLTR